jgi:outer membrane lipoprotein carrier protein
MRLRHTLAVLFLLVGSVPVRGEEAGATEQIVQRLQSAYCGLDTLQADFSQSLHSLALAAPQRESGILYVRRPSRMRWEYTEPDHKLAVVDGERTWLYIPEEGQVFVGSLAELRRGGALGWLLGDGMDLRRDFVVRAVLDEDGKALADSLSLVPRQPSEEFESIELTLAKNDLPRRIVVHGAAGDVMEYRLRRVRTGLALEDALFEFRPPEGVEVIPVE